MKNIHNVLFLITFFFPIINLFCMDPVEKNQIDEFNNLVRYNAAKLRGLVAREQRGFCPELIQAEKVLWLNRSKITSTILSPSCDPSSIEFVSTIEKKSIQCAALLDAADKNDLAKFQEIIADNRYVVNHHLRHATHHTPLSYILVAYRDEKEDFPVCAYMYELLNAGANPNTLDSDDGTSPMHHVQNVKEAQLLLAFGATLDHEHTLRGFSPLYEKLASFTDNPKKIKNNRRLVKFFICAGANINSSYTSCNQSPLHRAIQDQDIGIIKLLLEHNANVGSLVASDALYTQIDWRYKRNNNNFIRMPGFSYHIADLIRQAPTIKALLEPHLQKYFLSILQNSNHHDVKNFMRHYSWIDYTMDAIDGLSVLEWVKKQHGIKYRKLFENSIMFEQCLNRALLSADATETKRLLKAGARMNIGHKSCNKTMILQRAIFKHKRLANDNDNDRLEQEKKIVALLENGALVDISSLIEAGQEVAYWNLLCQKHAAQSCLICGNTGYLEDIPCITKHTDSFLCPDCYRQLKEKNKNCPLCNEHIGHYDTECGFLCEK